MSTPRTISLDHAASFGQKYWHYLRSLSALSLMLSAGFASAGLAGGLILPSAGVYAYAVGAGVGVLLALFGAAVRAGVSGIDLLKPVQQVADLLANTKGLKLGEKFDCSQLDDQRKAFDQTASRSPQAYLYRGPSNIGGYKNLGDVVGINEASGPDYAQEMKDELGLNDTEFRLVEEFLQYAGIYSTGYGICHEFANRQFLLGTQDTNARTQIKIAAKTVDGQRLVEFQVISKFDKATDVGCGDVAIFQGVTITDNFTYELYSNSTAKLIDIRHLIELPDGGKYSTLARAVFETTICGKPSRVVAEKVARDFGRKVVPVSAEYVTHDKLAAAQSLHSSPPVSPAAAVRPAGNNTSAK